MVLFRSGRYARASMIVDLDLDHMGPAADGTIFHVFLSGPLRQIDRDNDLFTAGVAEVAGFNLHDTILHGAVQE